MTARAEAALPKAAGHWLLGNAREMAASPHRFPAELASRHGGLAAFRILRKPFVAVADPDFAEHILVTNQAKYVRSFHYRNGQAITGKGLLNTEGDLWLKRRRQALPAFRMDNLKRIVPAACAA